MSGVSGVSSGSASSSYSTGDFSSESRIENALGKNLYSFHVDSNGKATLDYSQLKGAPQGATVSDHEAAVDFKSSINDIKTHGYSPAAIKFSLLEYKLDRATHDAKLGKFIVDNITPVETASSDIINKVDSAIASQDSSFIADAANSPEGKQFVDMLLSYAHFLGATGKPIDSKVEDALFSLRNGKDPGNNKDVLNGLSSFMKSAVPVLFPYGVTKDYATSILSKSSQLMDEIGQTPFL